MLKRIVPIIFFLFSLAGFAAVNSPVPRCVTVLSNGDINITWSLPSDTGGNFNSYHIYTSTSFSGPFIVLDSIFTYSQTSYTHIGASGNTASRYYYIQTRYSGTGGQTFSPSADTVRSIFLTVTNPGNGTAVLSWNPIATPGINSSTGIYNIYREYPTGTWTLAGTTVSLTFIDSILVCNDTINYKVEIADTTGCNSVSSFDGERFQNMIVPDIPVFDTLSVLDDNTAMMSWHASSSPDVAGYVIYKVIGGARIPIDTVYGISNISYNYLSSTAGSGMEEYILAAFDTCGNISPQGNVLNTIYLSSVPAICTRSVILSWNAYSTLGSGLAGYRIYQSSGNASGPYVLIGTVSSGTLTFTASGLAPAATYFYKIQAFDVSGSKTSSSNRISFYSSIPIPPNFSYLRSASIVDPDRVLVTCHVDVAASTLKYKVMRSTDGINYKHVGTIPKSSVTPVTYTDKNVSPDKSSYYYKVICVDSCGYDGLETNVAKTILLTAISNNNNNILTNTLTWNDYIGWSSISSYNIYRGIDGVMNPAPIANVPSSGTGTNTFVDDVSPLLLGEGVFNYRVEALEGPGNSYGFSDTSSSNIAEAYQEPLIYIPNAFSPYKDFNKVFIPVVTFVDIEEYEFSIFNRWGQQLFTTADVSQWWDGTYKGKLCEFGVYVYILRIKTAKGEYIDRKGSVMLLR